ncbi:hypothetical protein L208DRAFT_1209627, partial [Tricholoma matsutake]
DVCFMTLLFQSWFCPRCRFELCDLCYQGCSSLNTSPPTPSTSTHCKTWFMPVTIFSVEELQNTVATIKTMIASRPSQCLSQDRPPCVPELMHHKEGFEMQEMPRYRVGELTEKIFQQKWDNKEPFVLAGVVEPAPLTELLDLKQNGRKCCIVSFLEAGTLHSRTSTLARYFKSWDKIQDPGGALQIRDYPPTSDLQDINPRLYEAFTTCIENMFPVHMASRGPLNLFSYFPKGSVLPDLGPKLYISQADLSHNGTTFVHMDKSCAINVMLYSQPKGQLSGAHWNIWPSACIPSLSKALDPLSYEDSKMAHPIITEVHYISPEVNKRAFLNSRIAGWYTTQLPGEAVIIPPGCPHQVSNISNSLKIAIDFVSPSHISELEMLRSAFRTMNIAEGKTVHKDLLQLDVMLWYAW